MRKELSYIIHQKMLKLVSILLTLEISVLVSIVYLTVKLKNTITKIYVKNQGSGYSNKKVIVQGRPTNGDVQSGISTSDDYVLAYES